MTAAESKELKKGARVYWRGDAADSGVVTGTSRDAVSEKWSCGCRPYARNPADELKVNTRSKDQPCVAPCGEARNARILPPIIGIGQIERAVVLEAVKERYGLQGRSMPQGWCDGQP